MKKAERIAAFAKLGEKILEETKSNFDSIGPLVENENPWFTLENTKKALLVNGEELVEGNLIKWTENLREIDVPKIVGLVLAGNIPLVGFHDILSVLISGHFAAIKPSSKDTVLLKLVLKWLVEIEPRFQKNFDFKEKLDAIDAVIATGSTNTARYFEQYFSKYPNIIRQGRTSVAVLSGAETPKELSALADDIFDYFGLGCRNVSKIFLPEGYDLVKLLDSWQHKLSIVNHHKYSNNYDYYKSIYLLNKTPHLDSGFSVVTETEELAAPIALNYYEFYTNLSGVQHILNQKKDNIQCIVGGDDIKFRTESFGQTQRPKLWDYADGTDTLKFLEGLN